MVNCWHGQLHLTAFVDFLNYKSGEYSLGFGLCFYCSQKTILNKYDLIYGGTSRLQIQYLICRYANGVHLSAI